MLTPVRTFPVLVTVLMFLSLLWTHQGDSSMTDPLNGSGPYEWLVLVYIAGDNDLGEYGDYGNAAVMDIEEMEMSIPSSGVRVLALTDLKGPGNSALYDIKPDSNPGIDSPEIPLSDLDPAWSDELDMGKSGTLQRFLEYSLENNIYERSMFVMWDHGSGWYVYGDAARPPHSRGFAQDQTSGSIMYLDGMRDAFMNAESTVGDFKFDVIGHDTCYMGMMEIFYQLSPWSSIATGSMDEQPWYGYNYTFISSLDGGTPISPEDLVKEMVELFRKEYSNSSDKYHTIVAADTDLLSGEFIEVWDLLARSLFHRMYYLEEENNGLFNNFVGKPENVGIDSVDVGSFLARLIEEDLEGNITELAVSASSLYNRLILDSWMKPGGRNPGGTGITVYLPRNRELPYKSVYDGTSGFLNLTADTYWDEMIREFKNPVERISLNLSVIENPGELTDYDLLVSVTDTREDPSQPLPGADILINGVYEGKTDPSGILVMEDIDPGIYDVTANSGELFDQSWIKALNRPPVANITAMDPFAGEGMDLSFSGVNSFDPDMDRLTFRWDLDDSDGLDDLDSSDPVVLLKFPDEGHRTIRLTVNDSQVDSHVDLVIDVVNLPPVARLLTDMPPPFEVMEDQPFELDGSDSHDVAADMDELVFRFLLDGEPIRDWDPDPVFNTSISDSGSRNMTMEVRDSEGGMDHESLMISVLEGDPVPIISGPSSVFEDEDVTYLGNASYDTPSDLEGLSFRWYVDGILVEDGPSRTINFSWATSGIHTVRLEVLDDTLMKSGGVPPFAEKDVMVINRPPVARIEGPVAVPVMSNVTLDIGEEPDTISDMDSLVCEWDIDADGEIDLNGSEITFSPASEGNLRIMLKITDDDGDSSTAFTDINITNIDPVVKVKVPHTAWEDEVIEIDIIPGWDSPEDEGILNVTWELDGGTVGYGFEVPLLIIEKSGDHEIKVTAVDDQGRKGMNTSVIEVRNPVPNVILSGIPVKVEAGESFTAEGYRTKDNPSDMDLLVFRWYVDGELQGERNGRNETFTFKDPGIRTISLKVTDDDGDSFTVGLDVEVEEDTFLRRAVENVISASGLVILLVILILFGFLLVRITFKMRELRSPENEDDVETEIVAGSTGEGDVVSEGISPTSRNDKRRELDGVKKNLLGSEPGKVPPPPDMSKPEIPPAPSPGRTVIPPFDSSLLDR
jgi:hypothetical protein